MQYIIILFYSGTERNIKLSQVDYFEKQSLISSLEDLGSNLFTLVNTFVKFPSGVSAS